MTDTVVGDATMRTEPRECDVDRFRYGWHGPTVLTCPHCGGETEVMNYKTKLSVIRGHVCPECYPRRKRIVRWVKGALS